MIPHIAAYIQPRDTKAIQKRHTPSYSPLNFGLNDPTRRCVYPTQRYSLHFERVKELSLHLPSSHNDVQTAITRPYFVVSTFAWCHVTPHMMAIQLIYRYHMISSLSDEHNDDTNVEGCKMIQYVVVGEFLVCILKVYIQADSLLFAN